MFVRGFPRCPCGMETITRCTGAIAASDRRKALRWWEYNAVEQLSSHCVCQRRVCWGLRCVCAPEPVPVSRRASKRLQPALCIDVFEMPRETDCSRRLPLRIGDEGVNCIGKLRVGEC